MTASHVTGGGLGAVLGAAAVGLLKRYTSYDATAVDASVIGSAALSAGVALGHGVSVYGVRGLVGSLWRGSPSPAEEPAPGVAAAPPPAPPAGQP